MSLERDKREQARIFCAKSKRIFILYFISFCLDYFGIGYNLMEYLLAPETVLLLVIRFARQSVSIHFGAPIQRRGLSGERRQCPYLSSC